MNEYTSHPYEEYIPENATKLILGTIPPYRFCIRQGLHADDVDFYYGSRDNSFWELVSSAVHRKLHYENTQEAIDERKRLLDFLHMGIVDIIAGCTRQDGKADDASLFNIEHRDLKTFLSKYPQIDTLIYTSKNLVPMVNHFADKGYHERWDSKKKNGFVQINGKTYRVYILYSPSPNALRGVEEVTRKTQYIEFFGMK